jgi:hypothetical protein
VGRVGGVGRVGRVGGVGGVGLILGGLASACGKTGADSGSPSGPSPAPVVPSRVVELTVDEGIPSMGIRLTTDGPPFVAYSACRGLQNVSGMTITFTYEMEVLGENGEVYPTFSFAAPATMLGHLQGFSGCGTPRTYDFDLSHQTARSYRMRVLSDRVGYHRGGRRVRGHEGDVPAAPATACRERIPLARPQRSRR